MRRYCHLADADRISNVRSDVLDQASHFDDDRVEIWGPA